MDRALQQRDQLVAVQVRLAWPHWLGLPLAYRSMHVHHARTRSPLHRRSCWVEPPKGSASSNARHCRRSWVRAPCLLSIKIRTLHAHACEATFIHGCFLSSVQS